MLLKYSKWNSIYEEDNASDSQALFTFNFCKYQIFPKSLEYLSHVFLKGVQEYFPDAKYVYSADTVYNIAIPIGIEEIDSVDQTISIDFRNFGRYLVKYNGRSYPEPILQQLRILTKKVIESEFCDYAVRLTSTMSKEELIAKIVSKFQGEIKDVKNDLYYLVLMKSAGIFDEAGEDTIYFTLIANGIALDSIEKLTSIEIKEKKIMFRELEQKARAEFPTLVSDLTAIIDQPNIDDSVLESLAKRVADFIYRIYQNTRFSTMSLGEDSQFDKLYVELTGKLTPLITKANLGKMIRREMQVLGQDRSKK